MSASATTTAVPRLRGAGGTWLVFLVSGLVAVVVYGLWDTESRAKVGWLYSALTLASVLAVAAGIVVNRPRRVAPWLFFLAGLSLFLVGDTLFGIFQYDPQFQQLPDVFWLTGYAALIAGMALLVRARQKGRDVNALVDAAIITVGGGVLLWVFLVEPQLVDSPLSSADLAVPLLYPLLDMILLYVTTRMFVNGGPRSVSYRLIGAAVLVLLGSDIASNLIDAQAWQSPAAQNALDVANLLAYVLWGAAALHPSMADDVEEELPEVPRSSHLRLVALLLAVVLVPLAIPAAERTGQGLTAGTEVAIGIGTVALFLLVVVRLARLLDRHREAIRRETVLRRAGEQLVGTVSRDEILEAALAAAGSLHGEGAGVRTWLAAGPRDDATLLGLAGEPVPAEILAAYAEADGDRRDERRIPAGYLLVTPVVRQGELRAALLTESLRPLPVEVKHGLRTLASQTALALESSELAESLARRRSEERFRSLVQNASDVITVIDPDTTVRYQTPSVTAVLGYRPDELAGRRLADVLHPDDVPRLVSFLSDVAARPGMHAPLELRLRRADGSHCTVETITHNLIDDENVGGIVLTSRDISERKALERQLTHQAFHDSLTSLANRALFADRLQHALARSRGKPVAVLFVDLDDFKTVNDSLGHSAGDELLQAVAERLRRCLRAGDTCARLGGDEFALLLEDLVGESQARQVAERVAAVLRPSIPLQDKEVFVRASVGIAFGSPTSSAEELLRAADIAMYRAKSQGKGNYAVYEESMHAEAVERLELKADLQRGVAAGEFVLEYQPIIRLRDASVVGVEALVRWAHPQRGLLPPSDFIGLAEETGLIVPLGRWVVEEACRRAAEWPGRLFVSVNISGRQLQDASLVGDVRAALEASGTDPRRLVLEITESVLMHDTDAAAGRLAALKSIGVRLAIDDFGTGYSSLSYLNRFSVDILKIAKPFIDGLNAGGREEMQLARAIVRLGETLGLETVAEGIELAEQHEALSELGCSLGQGFLFDRPLGDAELAKRLGAVALVAG